MTDLRRILLVEDNPHDIELTLSALDANHIANPVDVARDGAEGLDYLYRRGAFVDRAGEDPVVVLLDLKMPRVDGLGVLRDVKANDALRGIPIVMLTSSKQETDLIEGYRLGVNAYVVKPVDFAQFARAIHDIGAFWAVLNVTPPRLR